MKTALVIGASRGIGSEFVQQLLTGGWKVFATARDEEGLAHLKKLGAETINLDVARSACDGLCQLRVTCTPARV